ncbi:hypothetical protein [Tsuneonella mangrovi]|uniref:hypothetical protein n=1 Tax=Tsuneonella mangrovi TaxID=1982042 RepID=UPI000BA28847|nr:hypothetical protein [Tsuneonella mangrovi]
MSDLAFHVRQFVPAAEGTELEKRIALLSARDYASGLLGQVLGDLAYNYAHDAHAIAGTFVFADVPPLRLELAVKCCRHLVMAAFLADHLEDEGTGS